MSYRDWSDVPLWRKAAIVLAVIVFFLVGHTLFDKELTIYTSAPAHPNLVTKQIYPVHVNHGYLRYLTSEETESLASWRAVGPALLAVALATIGVALFALRERPEASGAAKN